MYSKEFLDKDVVGSDGWKIGKSKEIIVDPVTWHVSQIEIELNEKIENEWERKCPYGTIVSRLTSIMFRELETLSL